LAPVAAVVFVILLVVGAGLIGDHPDPDAPEQEIADYFGDSGAHTRNIMGYYLWAVAGVTFLWFLSCLRSVLREAEGGNGTLANLGFAAGIVFTACLLVGAAPIAAVAAAIEFRDAVVTDPEFIRVLPQMGYGIILLGGGFSALVLVLTTSILTFQTGVLPQWLGWLGIVAAIILLFAVIFLPMVALLIWVLATSFALFNRSEQTAAAAA
jgi:hypothetical protein